MDICSKKQSFHTSGKLVSWNGAYLCSSQGLLNLLQIIVSYTCIDIMSNACRPAYGATPGGFVGTTYETHFHVSSYATFLVTNVIFWSFIFSQSSCSLVGQTVVMFIFWLVCASVSIGSSLPLLISIASSNTREFQISGYVDKMTVSILGLLNGLLYVISCLQAYRMCKSGSRN